jgi:hypothetical protein
VLWNADQFLGSDTLPQENVFSQSSIGDIVEQKHLYEIRQAYSSEHLQDREHRRLTTLFRRQSRAFCSIFVFEYLINRTETHLALQDHWLS